ncbi:MAG: OsmC family protein [Alcanivoracaceae bacterium]|nr:OsmC family protein [Alcanivoracaceae bacterium]
MISKVEYKGQLRTVAVHLQSNSEIITDAPIDNHGKGEAFSPTDLVATALASCMMTIMGIKAESMDIDLTNTSASIKKHMGTTPRRISEIEVTILMNQNFDGKTRKILEAAALTCPVGQSLHPETRQNIQFVYPN